MRIRKNLFVIYFIVGARAPCPCRGQTHRLATTRNRN